MLLLFIVTGLFLPVLLLPVIIPPFRVVGIFRVILVMAICFRIIWVIRVIRGVRNIKVIRVIRVIRVVIALY